MKTLKQRQAERAQRVLDNAAAEPDAVNGSGNTGNDRVGNVLAHVTSAQAAIEGLSEAEQAELRARLNNDGEPTEGYRDAATFPLAGIGTVNPFVVDVTGASTIPGGAQSGNGGEADPSNVSPADAHSAAVAAAAWGTGAPGDTSPPVTPPAPGEGGNDAADETVNEDGSPKTKAQLQEILKERNVTYESDANHARLTELVKANPAPASQA